MAILSSDRPLSVLQQRVNWGALLLLSLAAVAVGLWFTKQVASITSGYAADYDYAGAFFISIALCVLGLPLLIYWRTRWIGSGLIAAGVLGYVAFSIGMQVLLKENRVAWQHEKMVSFGPDKKASAVIYFHKEVTDREVEDFASSVLMGPAMPRHEGRDFPAFVSQYFRLLPSQANGHNAVALTFWNNSPPDKVNAYLATIKADRRVETVFLNVSPDSIHADSKRP